MINRITRPVWAEVDLGAVAHNTREIKRIIPKNTKIMAIVKANGYGHGAVYTAMTVLKYGADYLGVAILSEGEKLRDEGITAPILVMGYNTLDQVEEILNYNIATTVFSWEMAAALSHEALKRKEKAVVHIKIDTGMGRIGFLPNEETVDLIKRIAALPGLFLEGIYTHFAVADDDRAYTLQQLQKFNQLIARLEEEGIEIPLKHAANSAAVINLPETHLDMVRVGNLLYGLYPSAAVNHDLVTLKPAMELKARVAFVKKVEPGTSVSYGRNYIAKKKEVVATLPFGYADGYIRKLSNQSEILLRGKRVPVVGNICMDLLMVDASAVPEVEAGDVAVIFGHQGNDCIYVEEIAERLNTINYEIICILSERIPRIYLNEDI